MTGLLLLYIVGVRLFSSRLTPRACLIAALQQQKAQKQRLQAAAALAAGDADRDGERERERERLDFARQDAANAFFSKNLEDALAAAEALEAGKAATTREERMKFNFRTEMCGNFQKHGHCRYGNKCMFAHSREELRAVGSPLPPETAAMAEKITAAITHAQTRHDDAGLKRSERPGEQDQEDEGREPAKRARGEGGDVRDVQANPGSSSWTGALEKYSEEELCSGELFVCGTPNLVMSLHGNIVWFVE